jgi:hypothetical protein
MLYGLWDMQYDIWSMDIQYDMEYDIGYYMEYEICNVICEIWNM